MAFHKDLDAARLKHFGKGGGHGMQQDLKREREGTDGSYISMGALLHDRIVGQGGIFNQVFNAAKLRASNIEVVRPHVQGRRVNRVVHDCFEVNIPTALRNRHADSMRAFMQSAQQRAVYKAIMRPRRRVQVAPTANSKHMELIHDLDHILGTKQYDAHSLLTSSVSAYHLKDAISEVLRSGDYLASGHFSLVFSNNRDSSVVTKIGPLHDGWLMYAAYCMEHQTDRTEVSMYGVNVRSIVRHQEHGFYVAVLDRCDMTVRDRDDNCCNIFMDWRENVHSDLSISGLYAREYPGLSSFLAGLAVYSRRNNLTIDLHSENAMFRRDGTLCITDPFSFNGRVRP